MFFGSVNIRFHLSLPVGVTILTENFDKKQYLKAKYGDAIACTCGYCGRSFIRKKRDLCISLKREQKTIYCDRKCFAEAKKKREILECGNCSKLFERILSEKREKYNFCSRSCAAVFYNRPRKKLKPIKISKKQKIASKKHISVPHLPPLKVECVCGHCKKDFLIFIAKLKKTKSGSNFCSKSCRMSYYNKLSPSLRPANKRSFAEQYLYKLISTNYKNLIIKTNDRETLKSGLEIDIYIPEIKLGIEVNGPTHYFPIYGEKKFVNVKLNDSKKYLEMHNMGIRLLVIDISKQRSNKKTEQYLEKQFEEYITPIIDAYKKS